MLISTGAPAVVSSSVIADARVELHREGSLTAAHKGGWFRLSALQLFILFFLRPFFHASRLLGSENSATNISYGAMLTDWIAQQLTARLGLGLGRMIASQLSPRGMPVAALVPRPPHS